MKACLLLMVVELTMAAHLRGPDPKTSLLQVEMVAASSLEMDIGKLLNKLEHLAKPSLIQGAVKNGTNSSVGDVAKGTALPEAGAASKEATLDPSTDDFLKRVKDVKPQDMPLMLGLMNEMYDRFKKDIASANKMEKESKVNYKKRMEEWETKPEAMRKDPAMVRIHDYWGKLRGIQHNHWHAMLKVSHAGMARLQQAIKMMNKAVNKEPLTAEESKELGVMASDVPPEIVFLAVSSQVTTWCHESLQQLESARRG